MMRAVTSRDWTAMTQKQPQCAALHKTDPKGRTSVTSLLPDSASGPAEIYTVTANLLMMLGDTCSFSEVSQIHAQHLWSPVSLVLTYHFQHA